MRYEDIKTELHAFLVISGGIFSLVFGDLLPLLFFGVTGFVIMLARLDRISSNTSASFGVANSITLARLSLLVIVTLFYQHISPVVYGLSVLLVIIADGLDGYYARKLNEESVFGATFDMETDAFLAAVVTTVICIQMGVGIWLLVAGYLRYLFVFTLRISGLHREPTPHMPGARLLAVLFFISILLPFIFPMKYAGWGLIVGAILVCFSFAREFVLIVTKRFRGPN